MKDEAIAIAALKRKRDEHQGHVKRLTLAIEALTGTSAKPKSNAASLRMKKAWAKRKAAAKATLKPAEAVPEAA